MASTTIRTNTARTSAHNDSLAVSPEDIVRRLADVLGKNLLGFIVDRDARTVSRWIADENLRLTSDVERTVRNTYQVFALLSNVEGEHTIRAWFMGMNPQLEDEAPAEALAEGRFRETMAAARAFVNGG
ncbi:MULTISPECIES: hypothetical protein [unclassified Frigoribacterium]|uniref:hypothetical protein n=1 Tax=unclassified Frigoribacterium TaxID=2627005 RepID=UPI001565C045|nr:MULTISPECIES: hypothetical protein [unclassified Frigoribacterium]NQW87525.1 hypothetical protein [Frigoribacterium sp. VKM Ac-2860]NQX09666.1 hypothetical protein [Frigoribacterium sp. VKM Ac-2859]